MRKILYLSFIIEFSVLVIVFFVYEKTTTIKTAHRKIDFFEGDFPKSSPTKTEINGWIGYSFKEDFHLYWKTTTNKGNAVAELLENLKTSKNLRYTTLPVADTCILIFKPLKKGYNVISALVLDTIQIWIESKSRNTTLDTKYEFMANFLNSFKINGVLLAKEQVTPYFKEFQKTIPFWYLQPKFTFFLFLLGIIVIANVFTSITLIAGGKIPREVDPEWEIVTPHVIIHERQHLRNTFYSGCIAKKQNQILLYTFGRLRMNINLSELKSPPIFQGNKLVISHTLKIEFPDYESLIKWQAALS